MCRRFHGDLEPALHHRLLLCVLGHWHCSSTDQLWLHMRAVTQNAYMAAVMGIRTARSMRCLWLGSGLPDGRGGADQIGNVTQPRHLLHRRQFLVLCSRGRNLLGTLVGRADIGDRQQDPRTGAGAILGKIVVLARSSFHPAPPRGMFALKGRTEAREVSVKALQAQTACTSPPRLWGHKKQKYRVIPGRRAAANPEP